MPRRDRPSYSDEVPDLRPLRDTDVADVLALNEKNVVKLAAMDEARLHELHGLADRFDVVDLDGEFAGFVITFAPGTAYDSENYRWFTDRHGSDGFYYLDRIVLDDRFRRRGLGTFVYDEIEKVATPYGRLSLEVNLVPRNDASLAFHADRGYVEVGRVGDDKHTVSMMEKVL
jgi:predicted GNAT superfamily acetyltransferase